MKHKLFLSFVLLITVTAFTFSAAQSKHSVKELLSKLKGEVEKIVISTDEGEVTLEGDDAKEVYANVKNLYGEDSWTFTISEDDEDENVFFVSKKAHKDMHWISSDSTSISSKVLLEKIEGVSKKIEIRIEDDVKNITVTTIKDGEEVTENYIGEDAEEYLKKLEDDEEISILQVDKLGGKKDRVRVIIEEIKKKDKEEE